MMSCVFFLRLKPYCRRGGWLQYIYSIFFIRNQKLEQILNIYWNFAHSFSNNKLPITCKNFLPFNGYIFHWHFKVFLFYVLGFWFFWWYVLLEKLLLWCGWWVGLGKNKIQILIQLKYFYMFYYLLKFWIFFNLFVSIDLFDRNNLKNWDNSDQNTFSRKCGTNIYFIYSRDFWVKNLQ